MAEIEVTRTGVVERTGFRLSWGAIAAGFVVATALQMVLSTLGAAVGLVAFDPGRGDSAMEMGIGVLLWFAVTAVVTMWIGGMMTGRLAGVLTRGDGMLHGMVMWSLSLLLAVYFASAGLGRVIGGAADLLTRATASVAGAAAGAVGEVGSAAVGQAGSVDLDALQRQVQAALEQTGDPALQPDSLAAQAQAARGTAASAASNEQAARDIAERLRATAGEVGREDLVTLIAARTGMSRAEAERAADRLGTVAGDLRAQLSRTAGQVGETVGETAEEAANVTSKVLWGAFLLMGLSAGAAALGAASTARE